MIDLARHFGLTSDPFRARDALPGSEADRALSDTEARRFVDQRVKQAGGREIFTRAALDRVVAGAGGHAQRLRWLAGLAMLEAALSGARTVEAAHVDAAVAQAGMRPGSPTAIGATPAPPIPARVSRAAFSGASLTKAAAGAMVVMGLILGVALMGSVAVKTPPQRHAPAHPRASLPGGSLPEIAVATPPPTPVDGSWEGEDPNRADPATEAIAPPEQRPTMDRAAARETAAPTPPPRIPAPAPPAPPAYVQARAERPPPPPPPPPSSRAIELADAEPDDAQQAPPIRAATPRLFLHFRPADRDAATDLASRLEARGWSVVALREVGSAVRAPNTRFFYDQDAQAARALASDLSQETGRPTRATDMRDYPSPPRPGTIEVWLPPAD